MMRAVWNGEVVADTAQTVRLEGNHYFPPESLRPGFFVESPTRTGCPWKGERRGLLDRLPAWLGGRR